MKNLSKVIDNIKKLSNLSSAETCLKEIYRKYNFDFENLENSNEYFESMWNSDCENLLQEFLFYTGVHWNNYIYDTFFPYFEPIQTEYCIYITLKNFPKTIKKYFSTHIKELFVPNFSDYPKTWKSISQILPLSIDDISKTFYSDLEDFLSIKAKYIIKNKKVQIRDRVRYSLAQNKEFLDSKQGNSISYFHRRIKNWDVQVYNIHFSKNDIEEFRRAGNIDEVKASIYNFREIINLLGYIPNQNIDGYQMFQNVDIKTFSEISRLMKKSFFPCRYVEIYGSWIDFLKKIEVINKNTVKNTFGYKTVSKDGHLCNSLVEKNIDDFFFENNIFHYKEVPYPKEIRSFLKKNIIADWKIKDTYVEYFGLPNYAPYKQKMELKIAICNLFNIKLIALFPGDELKLKNIFSNFLS